VLTSLLRYAAFSGRLSPESAEDGALAGGGDVAKDKEKDKGNGTATAVKLEPLGDRVVVSPMSREETTKSGIVIPDTAKEKPQRGSVIAVGKGRRDDDGDRIAMDVEVGDQVLFAKYAGTEFKYEDEEYLILSEKDILAKVQE
jgi:chaperonin GroES